MAISKRTRFEVFKRDRFTCHYCGRKAPDVVLHVDHIEPQSKGGSDEMVNLITACDSCNGGKGAIRLADDSVVVAQRGELERLQERQEQIEMMLQWHKSLANMDQQVIDKIAAHWCELANWFGLNKEGEKDLKKWLKKHGENEVLTAMGIASEAYFKYKGDSEHPTEESANEAFHKIGGICRVRADEAEKPYLKNMYYVRGILGRRHEQGALKYINWPDSLRWIENAFESGADFEELKRIARDARSWTNWLNEMAEYIQDLRGHEGTA